MVTVSLSVFLAVWLSSCYPSGAVWFATVRRCTSLVMRLVCLSPPV